MKRAAPPLIFLAALVLSSVAALSAIPVELVEDVAALVVSVADAPPSVVTGTITSHFYFSGHGLYSGGMLANETSVLFGYFDVTNHWNKDLDCVIFAACSVLDIGDYNHHFANQGLISSPGIAWATTGPRYLLGYNYAAPGDKSGAPAEIVSYWVSHHTSDDIINAWMEANRREKAWNACAIDTLLGEYHYFQKGFLSHSKKVINRGDW